MLLNLPFYKNKSNGNQCMQVAMKTVLKHFLNKNYSLEELDKLTRRKKDMWTWTSQVAITLHQLGLNIRYYSKEDLRSSLKGQSFIKRNYSKDADKILNFTDLPILIDSIKRLMKYNIFEKRILSFEEIKDHIKKGHIPLMLINYNKLIGKKDLYQGHFVVVTGFDEKNIFYHESGPNNPELNKKTPKEKFIEAWNSKGTDNDVIIVFGKK